VLVFVSCFYAISATQIFLIANISVLVFTGRGRIYHEKKSTLNVGSSKLMLESFSMEYTQQAFIRLSWQQGGRVDASQSNVVHFGFCL
jgi:hypothetical protein